MARRSGPSISVKMILTSTLLILVIVVGLGWLGYNNVRDIYDATTAEKIEVFRDALEDRGKANTLVLSQSLRPLLINTAVDDIRDSVTKTAKEDPNLRLVYVLHGSRRVMLYCEIGAAGEQTCPTDREGKPIDDPTWQASLAGWQARRDAGDSNALISFDGTDDARPLRLFAYPVTAASPTPELALVEDNPDDRHGYVVLGYDTSVIQQFVAKSGGEKREAQKQSVIRTGVLGFLFVLVGTLLAVFQGLQISKPIKLLAWKADQIARGDLEARVEVRSTDEIGLLGENFNYMAGKMIELLSETRKKATLEKELEVARTIQDTLVPTHDPVAYDFFDFAGYFQPASECGGDWWSHHELVGDKILIIIGDVTGHGVPSAMITAAAKASCDVARAVHGDDVTVSRLLEIMNNAIYQSAKRRFVMTCFASIIDPRASTITYANAGHNFPYLYRAGEDGRGEFGSLMIRGNRLGDLRESHYEAKTAELQAGDLLIWYTDGIVECENTDGEEYGEKRFRASIRRVDAEPAAAIRDAVVKDATAFYGAEPRKDDITLVVARVR